MRILRNSLLTGLAGILVGAGIAGGIAAASSIPGPGGLISGCRNTSTGALRVINGAKKTCAVNEKPLDWYQGGGASVATTDTFPDTGGTATLNLTTGSYILGGQNDGGGICSPSVSGGSSTNMGEINGGSLTGFVEITASVGQLQWVCPVATTIVAWATPVTVQ